MRTVAKLTQRRTWPIAGLAALCAVAAAACGGSSGSGDVHGARIFETVPWTGEERFIYRLSDRGVDGEPICELLTEPETSPGVTQLEERCTLDQNSDQTVVLVGSDDLHPIRSERTIVDEDSVTHTIEYSETDATFRTFRTDDPEESRETTRDLPEPTEEYPDPAWYDDKSLFWLVRGLPLATGYESTYVHVINAGAPRVLAVDVSVEARETIETPAGTFESWKVRVERDNTVYFLWVADEGVRPVVKARIEGWTYDLIDADPALD